MRFFIDVPLSPELCVWLAAQGHDAVHAFQVGLGQVSDVSILEYARREGRIVVTADLDYPRLLALQQTQGPGLMLFRGGNYTNEEVRERFLRALETVPSAEWPSSIIVVEKKRIRRRRLPLAPTP